MKKAKVSLILVWVMLLTGCWGTRQLEEVSIYFGLGIDLNKDTEGHITITASGPTTQEEAMKPVRVISSSGKTLREAMRNLQAITDRHVTMGHLSLVIFGKELAQQGLEGIHIDSLGRDPEIRGNLLVAVADGRAMDALSQSTEDHPHIAMYISNIIDRSSKRSLVPRYTLRDLFQCLTVVGRDPMMPYIKLGPDGEPRLNNTAIFSGSKLVGEIGPDETFALLMLKNELVSGRLTVDIDEEKDVYMTVILSNKYRRVRTRLEGEQLHIDIDIRVDGDIMEHTTVDEIANSEILEKKQEFTSRLLEKRAQELMNRLQREFNSDPIGFGKFVHAYHHKFFENNSWKEIYKDVKFNIKVDTRLRRTGTSM